MRRHGLRCRGRDRAHLFSLIMPCASRSPRGRCACAVRTATLQGAAAHLGTHAFRAKQALCQSIRPLRWRLPPLAEQQIGAAVGRNKRRGAKSALPICGHPAHGWAPPAVGTPGEGGDDHRQRRHAATWSLHERQPAPWAVRGVSSSGQDAHASCRKLVWPQALLESVQERCGRRLLERCACREVRGPDRGARWPPRSDQPVGSVLAPPAPGRARRDTRWTLVRHGPSAAQAPRTASGLGWHPCEKTSTPVARGCWHRVCTPTGGNRRLAMGPCATPEASPLSNLTDGEERQEDKVATLALAQHCHPHANARMQAWTGIAGRAGTRTTYGLCCRCALWSCRPA